MATVTSFEGLRHPRRTDLHQFAELFEPLFIASSDEARRQAAAALSQAQNLPESVALLIGSMPIGIAAAFLTRAPAISDRVLIEIISQMGSQHAAAIARRDNLSPLVVDALVDRHQAAGGKRWEAATSQTATSQTGTDQAATDQAPPATQPEPVQQTTLPTLPLLLTPIVDPDEPLLSALVFAENNGPDFVETDYPAADEIALERARVQREEALRKEIKALARAARDDARRRRPLPPASPTNGALLVRFARSGERFYFRRTLAASLGASEALADRILLDVSGRQLSLTLSALGVDRDDTTLILKAVYPHLGERLGITTKADHMSWASDNEADRARVEAWVRADTDNGWDDEEPGSGTASTYEPVHAPERPADPRRQPAAQKSAAVEATRTFGKRSAGARR